MGYNSAKEALGALVHAYYNERNVDATLSCVTDDIEWVGTEDNDSAKGKTELRELLEADVAAFPYPLSVEFDEPDIQQLGADAVIITVTGEQQAVPGMVTGFAIRRTACCIKSENGWLIANVHTSVPNAEVEKIRLQHELNAEIEKQATLLNNVPGGVAMYRIKKSGRIATDYVSEGLAKICRYDDSKDIMRDMAYDSRKLVLPEDYPTVAAACKASLETGKPTSVNYRIFGKDGTPVRITLDSVVMKNAVLGEDDVAVFYAVQTLVNDETQRIIEDQKVMANLLNTMPGGIGIFEMKNGVVSQLYINNAFYNMIGSKREERSEYFGDNVMSAAHKEDMPNILSALQELLDGSDTMQVDYRLMAGNGEWIWLHVATSVVERREDYIKFYAAYYDCTESKMQQLQLMQNLNAVELAQRQGDLSIWTFNIDKGLIIQQTPADVEGHMGYPVYIEDVPNCFVQSNSVHPDDVEKFLDVYKKLYAGEEKADELYRLLNRNTGSFDWTHMYYQRMKSNENSDRMAVGFSMNSNIQQEAVEQYRIEQKLREHMYADAVMYIEYNLMTNRYEANNNLSKTYLSNQWECPTTENYRENMKTAVDAAFLDVVVDTMYSDNLLKAFEKGETKVSCDYRSKERPGMPAIWYRITATMAKRPDTGDVMAFIYLENIDKEKKRQLALESSMRDGIESIAVISVADGQTRLIRADSRLSPADIGTHFIYDDAFVYRSHAVVVPEEREFSRQAALLSTVKKELESKEIYQYSVSLNGQNGILKRQLFRFRYLDDRKTDIVLSISDISSVYEEEQKKNVQLQAALKQAQEANRAKTDFLSRVSHDMRTPLNGILGLTTLLKDSITDDNTLKDLSELEMSGRYLLELINDTLDMSRIESGNLELHPVVYDGRVMFNSALRLAKLSIKGRNIKLNVKTEDLPFTLLYVDISRFEQIVMNVFGNAAKFTPDGGSISISLSNVSIENGVITDKLVIADTGIGMSPEFLPHIFEAFSQADSSKTSTSQGTGLGLAITKQLLERMGGDITVESQLGKGSTFTMILKFPIATDEQIAQWKKTRSIRPGNGADLNGKRVLLCEDHPLNTQIAIRLLNAKKMEVEHAENGKLAVDMFKNSVPGYYDAILMDIRMPVMDGIEAAQQIRALARSDARAIPIIAMTANAFADDIEQTAKAGMNAHLSKPIQTEMLYQTLAELLNAQHDEIRQRILVVDDIEVNRSVIRSSLEDDYEIIEAANGKQAFEVLKNTSGIDAVITDIQMPEMDGIELIRRIRSDNQFRHMVIIANTQFGDPQQEEQLLALGANDFVYKPTTPKIVEIRVRNALKRI